MGLHDVEFFLSQSARFVQDHVRYGNLPDVMQRCGMFHIEDKLIRQLIRIIPEFLQLIHDDPGISRRLPHMIPCGLIPALHHIRQHHDQCILHLRNGLGFCPECTDVITAVLRGLGQSLVHILDLVSGVDVQTTDPLHIFLERIFFIVSEFAGTEGHGIDGNDDVIFRDPEPDGDGENQEADKDQKQPRQEAQLLGGDHFQ